MEALEEKQSANIIIFPALAPIKTQEPEEYSPYKTDGKLKARKMESIESYYDFALMEEYFLDRGDIRNWTIWTAGIGFGFRISDLLKLKIGWLLHDDKRTFRDKLTIIEKKTKKLNGFPITEAIRHALTKYFDSRGWNFELDDYVFKSRKAGRLTERSVWKILSNAGAKVLPGLVIGTHTLRKSHVSILFCLLDSNLNMSKILAAQMALNHSDFRTTMRYLGITDKDLNRGRALVSDFVLGKTNVNELTIAN